MYFLLLAPKTQEDGGRYNLIRAFSSEEKALAEIERQVRESDGWYSRLDFVIAKDI